MRFVVKVRDSNVVRERVFETRAQAEKADQEDRQMFPRASVEVIETDA